MSRFIDAIGFGLLIGQGALLALVILLWLGKKRQKARDKSRQRVRPRKLSKRQLANIRTEMVERAEEPGDVDVPGAIAVGEIELNEDLPDFFSDLESLFRKTLAERPGQIDVRLKLLEICHSIGDADKFIAEALIIRDQLGSSSDPRWNTVVTLGASLLPNHPMFRADGAMAEGARTSGRHYDLLARNELDPALAEVQERYAAFRENRGEYFRLFHDLQERLNRPTPLSLLWPSGRQSGAAVYLKRENEAGSHAITINAYGQVLMAHRLGYRSVVSAARTVLHADAFSRICEALNIRGSLFVEPRFLDADEGLANRLKLAGTKVERVTQAGKDCRILALQQFSKSPSNVMYISDLGGGPSPYPQITREMQGIVGMELMRQLRAFNCPRPDALVAAYEAGQAAMGLFVPFLENDDCAMYCTTQYVDQRATGSEKRGAREHAWLRACGRVDYREVKDELVKALFEASPELHEIDRTSENGRVLALSREIAAGLPMEAAVIVMLADARSSLDSSAELRA